MPVVVILHGQTDISCASRLGALKSTIVRRVARKVVFVSENLRRDLQDALPLAPGQAAVIPNGVDTDAFFPNPDKRIRQQLGLTDSDSLVGAVGNIRDPKDYPTFLRTASILCRQNPGYCFVISGEGRGSLFDELLALRASLGLDDKLTFLGLRADVATVMNNLDIFALSSKTEGCSIACIEAMACGVPVVATRSGGPDLIIESGVSGLLVPVKDPQALADSIGRIANDPALARRLRDAGLQRARSHYSLPAMLRAYEDLLGAVAECR